MPSEATRPPARRSDLPDDSGRDAVLKASGFDRILASGRPNDSRPDAMFKESSFDRTLASGRPDGADPDAVSLWWLPTDRPLSAGQEARLLGLLSPDEHERRARLRFDRDRRQWLLARALLRLALARQTGRPPASLRFARLPHGKPALADGAGPCFNLSHAAGMAVCALAPELAPDLALGVDVERQDRQARVDDLARRWLATEEQDWLAGQTEDRRGAAFMRLWTLKEAYVKALGRGLTLPLSEFAIGIGPDDRPRLRRADPEAAVADWQLEQWPLADDYWMALALPLPAGEGHRAIRCREATPLLADFQTVAAIDD